MADKLASHYRFYIPPGELGDGSVVRFSERESRHMLASLRLSEGDIISATDGEGSVYRIKVEDTSGRRVVGRIEESKVVKNPGPPVYIFQAVIRPARMELVVEKAAELGVWGIVPVRTSRSRTSLGPAKIGRLRRTATEAIKQSLGAFLPEIKEVLAVDEALETAADFDLILVALEGDGVPTLSQVLSTYRGGMIALWIGPEGGFSDSETQALDAHGAVSFALSPRRLKSETAAIASLAALHALIQR